MACRPIAGISDAECDNTLWTCESPWDWPALLTKLATADERLLAVRMLAEAFKDVPRAEQPAAVLKWVQDNVTWTKDQPPLKLAAWLASLRAGLPGQPFERFGSPERTIALGMGDCDDSARLVRAVLRSLGHDARLCFLGNDGSPSHVTAYLPTAKGRYWLDASLAALPGEHPFDARKRLDATDSD